MSVAPTLPDLDSFSLHVTIFVAPENVDKLFAAFKPVFELICAEKEFTFFELYQDPASPGTLSWVENWCVTLVEEGRTSLPVHRDMSPQLFMAVGN